MTVIAPLSDLARARARLDLAEDRRARSLTTVAEANLDLLVTLYAQHVGAVRPAQPLDDATETTLLMVAALGATTLASEAEAEAKAAAEALDLAMQAMVGRLS